MSDRLSLELQLAPGQETIFFPLLQEGVELELEVGCSVRELLARQFGIPGDYQASRISTIFLNHQVVDDAAAALVGDGAILALSGAMPGLVGATMRRGGRLAGLRDGITYRNPERVPEARRGRIHLKLFNLLLPELAPRILRRGILLAAERCCELLAGQAEPFPEPDCWLEGRRMSVGKLKDKLQGQASGCLLQLRVHFGDERP
ncbi:hypothetical protein EDC39_10317 [Geothermobacter ehrlichii]|uniref:Uncharacterized protein n=1 Tax=Geothermobacter ehrlichii TaxID=213224 RepID=A0A5D3WJM4_9BACT|nr:hypothetical protein [Geothermobacter ehrlichii]TYO99175.1 hypothetical protein EDC39_10317 [Geothermobacter ehrlichii]